MWDKAASAQSVAEFGATAMEKGELIVVNEASMSFMLKWVVPLLPRRAVLKMSRGFMEKGN
jgi:hypothetical protein